VAGSRLGEGLIFFSLGLPGRLADWCDAVLARLVDRLPGEVVLATWPPLTQMFGYDGITPVLDQVAVSLIETSAALPAGSWTARVLLGFSPEAAGHTFLVDAYSGGQLSSTSFQPQRAGVYTVDLNFSIGEPSGQGVEIRVWVWGDYARGQVAFGHVILRPIAMRQPDAIVGPQEDFRAVLDL